LIPLLISRRQKCFGLNFLFLLLFVLALVVDLYVLIEVLILKKEHVCQEHIGSINLGSIG